MTIETNIPFAVGVITGILATVFIITRKKFGWQEWLGSVAIYIIGRVVASGF